MRDGAWIKSSRCESHHCVEVHSAEHVVHMRNSKADELVLTFSREAWRQFSLLLRAETLHP